MTKAFLCDICGEYFAYEPEARIEKEPELYCDNVNMHSYDICVSCWSDLSEHIKGKRNEFRQARKEKRDARRREEGEIPEVVQER